MNQAIKIFRRTEVQAQLPETSDDFCNLLNQVRASLGHETAERLYSAAIGAADQAAENAFCLAWKMKGKA